jgi:hypothetical protein
MGVIFRSNSQSLMRREVPFQPQSHQQNSLFPHLFVALTEGHPGDEANAGLYAAFNAIRLPGGFDQCVQKQNHSPELSQDPF